MANKTYSKNFPACVTCAKWCGSRQPNGTRSTITFEENQKGECVGGGFNHTKMSPIARCSKYQQWL